VDTVLVASAQWILAAAIHSVHHPAILLKVLLANVVGVRKVESVHQATIVLMWLGYKNVDQTRKVLTQTKDALLVLSDGKMLLLLAHQLFQKEILAQVLTKTTAIRARQWITPSAAARSAPICTPIVTPWIRP
jgi:hypothetical protein